MFQEIFLVGNLAAKPELRFTPSGVPVASFSLAVNRTWTDGDGNKKEKVVWFRCTVWRALAENCEKWLDKGSRILVVGEIEEARPYTDRDGNQRASIEITAQTVKFLSGKGDGSDSEEATAQRVQKAVPQRVADNDPSIPF